MDNDDLVKNSILDLSTEIVLKTIMALNEKKEAILLELINRYMDGHPYALRDLTGRMNIVQYVNNPERGDVYVIDGIELVEFFPPDSNVVMDNLGMGCFQTTTCQYRILLPAAKSYDK